MLRKTIILAAGRGTRVPPPTHDMPKRTSPLPGKPVMQHSVEQLARHGVRGSVWTGPGMSGCGNERTSEGARMGLRQ